MDIRILTLLVLIGAVGSLGIRAARNAPPEGNGGSVVELIHAQRTRRAVNTPNGESKNSNKTESTTSQTPTPTPTPTTSTTSTPKPTTGSVTPKPNPTTSPTTSSPNPTTARTSNPPPMTTKAPATSTVPPTESTTKSTPKPEKPSTSEGKPGSQPPAVKPDLSSRFSVEPENECKNSKEKSVPASQHPGPAPSSAPAHSSSSNPRGYPPLNSIPGNGNYAWTSTRNGPGSASASASASSSSGGPSFVFPGQGPTFHSRGAFVNTPNNPFPNPGNAVGPSYHDAPFAFPDSTDFSDPFGIQKEINEHFRKLQQQIEAQQRAMFEVTNRLGTDGTYNTGPDAAGPQVAYSSIGVGQNGGYQMGGISPSAPGLESRFAESVPAPSGNSFGVFSSSSSTSGIGPDGKPFSRKSAATGVNDNGKVTYRVVHD